MTDLLDRPALTDKQRRILEWVRRFRDERGYCCTVRELCREFQFGSPNAGTMHLNALRRKGYVTWEPNASRTIRIVEVPHGSEQ